MNDIEKQQLRRLLRGVFSEQEINQLISDIEEGQRLMLENDERMKRADELIEQAETLLKQVKR